MTAAYAVFDALAMRCIVRCDDHKGNRGGSRSPHSQGAHQEGDSADSGTRLKPCAAAGRHSLCARRIDGDSVASQAPLEPAEVDLIDITVPVGIGRENELGVGHERAAGIDRRIVDRVYRRIRGLDRRAPASGEDPR